MTDFSDHYSIFCVLSDVEIHQKDAYKIRRRFNDSNKYKFKSIHQNIDWSSIYNYTNTETVLSHFYNTILLSFNKCFALKKRYPRKKKKLGPCFFFRRIISDFTTHNFQLYNTEFLILRQRVEEKYSSVYPWISHQ